MKELVEGIYNVITTSGGTVAMAILFVIFLFYDRKDKKEISEQEKQERKEEKEASQKLLNELSASNRNIAESLNLLKTSMDNTNNEFRQHDERAIKQFNKIHEDLVILKERK